jgi:hypothetical protein
MGILTIVALLAQAWQTSFAVDATTLADQGESVYFLLKPGCQSTFGSAGGGKLVILVLADTLEIGGVTTRVVEEREWKGARLVEVSRNYYAMDRRTGDAYYFGEDVDSYTRGKVSHQGSWRHGRGGATFGLMMPASPYVGMKFYEEQAKGTAMDRAEIVGVGETVTTPGGRFDGVVRVRETTPLEPLSREYKLYAPGVGLVQDGEMTLVSHVCLH